MKVRLTSWLMAVLLVCPTSRADPPALLSLAEVQAAALRAFPGLLASEQLKDAAEGRVLEAEGGFDTLLKSKNQWSVVGLYENRNVDVGFEQATPFLGATFFGGWRRGSGDYPVYEGKSLTATDGEARIGVNLPLWRNRDIDRRRAGLLQAELGKLIASHEFDQSLIDIRRMAGHRYWDWVLAGQRLHIAEKLLAIAEQRNAGILERVAAGDIPEFEALDNQRAIIERRERVVAATRLLEQSAIQLSLYWRDADGQPQLPGRERLPNGFPEQAPPISEVFDDMLGTALSQRPELKRLALQIRQSETEVELQDNQRAPGIDLSVLGAKDIGDGKYKLNRDELYVGLNVDIPLQQRVASGRGQTASANLRRLRWERKGAEDRIAAEVKDVLSALHAARQRLQLSREQQQAARMLEDGERTRFDLGETTILFVNLREIAAGDAALMAAEAGAGLFKANVDYQAVIGQLQ
ncbi:MULTISPECIES: TolC family protein [Methylomonas]|uniref:TolC family protein n=1 Tax=Methylomonas TaxID=416 RepID=UPI001232AD65|nr:TolC family protein [Methylomonas rhizoryzae]